MLARRCHAGERLLRTTAASGLLDEALAETDTFLA